jgi:hypothetical protein
MWREVRGNLFPRSCTPICFEDACYGTSAAGCPGGELSVLRQSTSVCIFERIVEQTELYILWHEGSKPTPPSGGDCLTTTSHSFGLTKSKSRSYVTTDGQSVSVSSTHLGSKTSSFLLPDNCGFVDVGRPLWREDGSSVYNCCWSSPAQSFSGPSPSGLMTIFYCLRFETAPTWRAMYPYLFPPGIGRPSYTPRYWVAFSSPLTARRATMEVFAPASTRAWTDCQSQSQSYFTTGGLRAISSSWRQAPWDSGPEIFSTDPLWS